MNEQNFPQSNEPIQDSKKIWIIVVSIAVTALIVGSVVYTWQRSDLKSTEQSLQQQITLLQNQISQLQQTQSNSNQQTADDTVQQNNGQTTNIPSDQSNSNQQTADDTVQQNNGQTTNVTSDLLAYKNLGFEISYPKTWIIDKSYESEGVIWLRTKNRQADLDAKKMTRVFDIEIRVYNNADELPNNEQDKFSFEDWINKKADEYGFVERSTIIIDGVKGYKGVASGETYGDYLQFVENKGKMYQIEIEGTATEEKMNIVNSFRFAK